MGSRMILTFAAVCMTAMPALAQTVDRQRDRLDGQTPEEIAAIDALNRVQIERTREAEARAAELRAQAEARAEAYNRELEYNQQLWFDYETRAQEHAQAEAEYRRALAEQARIEAACRGGDLALCDQAWRERGLPPPPR